MAKVDFINPFEDGVSYVEFLEAVGKKTVEEYCKGKLEQSQIDWLIEDLKHFKQR